MSIKGKKSGPMPTGILLAFEGKIPARSEIADEDKQTIHRLRKELKKGKRIIRELLKASPALPYTVAGQEIYEFLGGPEH